MNIYLKKTNFFCIEPYTAFLQKVLHLGLLLFLFISLSACEKTLDYEKAVKNTSKAYLYSNDSSKTNMEKQLLEFFNTPIPSYPKFQNIHNSYLRNEKTSEADSLQIEKNAISSILEFYKELIEMQDSALTKGKVEDFLKNYKKALETENHAEIEKAVNFKVYYDSLKNSDIIQLPNISNIPSFGMHSDMASKSFESLFGLLGALGTQNFASNLLAFDKRMELSSETNQFGEDLLFLQPTRRNLDSAKVILVDSNLALLAVTNEQDAQAFYSVADIGSGLQIISVSKTEQNAKEVAYNIMMSNSQFTLADQQRFFENRIHEIDASLNAVQEIIAYKKLLGSAIESKDVSRLNSLINYKYLFSIESFSIGFLKAGEENKPYATNYSIQETDLITSNEDKLSYANDLYYALEDLEIVEANKYGIILQSDDFLFLERQESKELRLEYVVNSTVGFTNHEIIFESLHEHDANIEQLIKETQEKDLAINQMLEILYSQLEISNIEWEVVRGRYSGVEGHMQAVVRNNSDTPINLSRYELLFLKDNEIILSDEFRSQLKIPAQKAVRLTLNTELDEERTYYFSLVESGELDILIRPRKFSSASNEYSIPLQQNMLPIERELGTWRYGDFVISEVKDIENKLPTENYQLSSHYKDLMESQKNENIEQSIQLGNAILDKIQVTSSVEDSILTLSIMNNTDLLLDRSIFSIDFTLDDVMLGSFTTDYPYDIPPHSAKETRVRISSEMLGYVRENAQMNILTSEIKTDLGTIKRDSANTLGGFISPMLEGKSSSILFSNKKQ